MTRRRVDPLGREQERVLVAIHELRLSAGPRGGVVEWVPYRTTWDWKPWRPVRRRVLVALARRRLIYFAGQRWWPMNPSPAAR